MRNLQPVQRALAVATAACTFAAALTPSAQAVETRGAYADAAEHYAGSQIAKHEGTGAAPTAGRQPLGNDVSRWQGEVNWASVARKDARFSYIKATEGTGYRNPHFAQQYNGAYDVGLIRGAYHFARPDLTGGAAQAKYFVRYGGRWSADGRTLPGALDMEYNPYGDNPCFGLTRKQMRGWIESFVDTYEELAGRPPAIYTSTSWWKLCTGNSPAFGQRSPLWIARYNDHVGELPAGWPTHTVWQFADHGSLPGDQNYFNGSLKQLRQLATS